MKYQKMKQFYNYSSHKNSRPFKTKHKLNDNI